MEDVEAIVDEVVIQADRDAAADHMVVFYEAPEFWREKQWAETMIRPGEDDSYPLVQAFAKHRLAAVRTYLLSHKE